MSKRATVRVGSGAGTSDDRMVPALELAERGALDFLVFECLAERTVARESLARSHDPDKGYTPSLHERLLMVLPACMKKGVRIVSNMGAANPLGGAKAARREARELGLGDVPCAVVVGDDVTGIIRGHPELPLMETGEPLESILPRVVSANAYLGADVVCEALATGAPIVLTGRVADPSLYLAPMMHALDWSYDDLPKIAAGTAAGHLLECTAMVTGGCFGWPRKKDVPDLARVGYPFADVGRDGTVSIGKTPDSGGRLDVMTCTEQLIYEMHDPTAYITPDCVLDITGIWLRQETENRVRLRMAGRTPDRRAAHAIGFEVRAMHMHGPGGAGGGCDPRVRQVLAVKSVLLPRRLVNPQVVVEGSL